MGRRGGSWWQTGRQRVGVRAGPMAGVLAVLLLALAALAPPALAQPRFDFRTTPGRLDKAVLPLHQRLAFDLDPARDRFGGETEITLRLTAGRDHLLLHAAKLTPLSAQALDAAGVAHPLKVTVDEAAQTWRLTREDGAPWPAGPLRVRLSWTGLVQRAGQGLFRAEDASGPMLATQLQAVFAREMFPGFDEPAFRVPYEVSIRAPAALQALSNMPVVSVQDDGTKRMHRFAPTPAMPAYLLALAVGPLEFLEGNVHMQTGALPLRIVTMPGKSAQGAFAMQATQQLMPYFERRFGQPYTLPKLDQLAVPSTRFGAMEDWGLASYTEGGLLLDPARDGVQRAIGIHNLIAHELAHQWFGNLVTAASWEDIWLNEAFATWLADEASHHFHPEWQLPLGRRAQLDRVLALDAGGATRAIRGGAVEEQQVFQVFDGITYSKGGAILSMLQHWLGVPTFDRGLQAYMADRRLSNATAGDLWHHLGVAAGRDVRRVASGWTDRPGHPLLRVTQRCEGRDAGARSVLTVAQSRFRMDVPAAGRRPEATLWHVPVVLARGDAQHVVLLTQAQQRFELPGCDAQRPWRANAGGMGFYRVLHDPAAHARLVEDFATLPAVDRLTLLSDTQALVQAGQRPFADWLALAERVPALPPAQRPEALRAVLAGWAWFVEAAEGGQLAEALRQRARAMLAPELQRLGRAPVAGEPVADSTLRASLIGVLSRWGDEALLEHARHAVRDDLAGRHPLPPATRPAWFRAAGLAADAALYDELLQAALRARSGAERGMLLEAVAANRDPALAARTLALSIAVPAGTASMPSLGGAEAFELPERVARASPHAALAYAHAVTHFDALMKRVEGAGWGEREGLLPDIASRLSTRAQAEQLLRDQQRLAGPNGAVNAQRAAQEIALRVRWREAQGGALQGVLQGR